MSSTHCTEFYAQTTLRPLMTAKLKILSFIDRNVPVLEPASAPAPRLRAVQTPAGWDATEVWRSRIKPAQNARPSRR